MPPERKKRVVVLYWAEEPRRLRVAIAQHLRALEYAAGVEVVYVNTCRGAPAWIRRFRPDAVLLHTTFLCLRWSHLFPTWKWRMRWVSDLECPKIAMPQDEYDHSEILDEWLYELGVTTILSNFDESVRDLLYPIMGSRAAFGKVLTGYVDDATVAVTRHRLEPIAKRPNDVVYRASHLPYWFGSHGQLKHEIGDLIGQRAEERGLRTDISTNAGATILGDAWLDFLASSKAVIGCESGSSVLDRRGEIRARIRHLLSEHPDLSFEDVAERMPPGWDAYAFFAISPRHLEALTTKTCQVLVEGRYDDILDAGRHYVSIRRDLTNVDEVLDVVDDHQALQEIADTAYAEIVESRRYSYSSLAAELERFLAGSGRDRSTSSHAAWRHVQRGVAASEAAERLRPRIVGRALGVPRSVAARGYAAFRLARKRSAHWQLLDAYRGQETVPVSKWALLADMLRLGLIADARAGELNAGTPFHVTVTVDRDTSTLRFESRAARAEDPTPSLDVETVASLRRITWDHSKVDTVVPYALTRRRWISIGIGDRGTYDFRALTALAPELPEHVTAALQATLSARPTPSRRLLRVVRHPHVHGRLVLAVFGARSRLPRGFAQRYARDSELRSQVPPDLLAVDLLRLVVLERFERESLNRIETDFDPTTGTFVARSVGASAQGEERAARSNGRTGVLRRIVWDHSDVGTSVPCLVVGHNPPPVTLGSDGIYVFEGLNRIAARYPEEAWRLVSGITGKR